MKQPDLFLRVRIGDDGAIRLVTIARGARKSNVLEDRFSAGRAWHDVLEFKDGDRQVFCRAAISTAVGEMLTNLAAEISGDINAHAPVAPAC